MATLPFALSVHHFISSVGADAGFAALIAVALLVLLYFSQARETATLRKRAEEAGQRVRGTRGRARGAGRPRCCAAGGDLGACGHPESGARACLPWRAGTRRSGRRRPRCSPRRHPRASARPALAAATKLIPDPLEAQPTPVGLLDGPTVDGTVVNGPSPVAVPGGNGSSAVGDRGGDGAGGEAARRPGREVPARPAQPAASWRPGTPGGATGPVAPRVPRAATMAMGATGRKTRTGRAFGGAGRAARWSAPWSPGCS